jgi:hypothetical protein
MPWSWRELVGRLSVTPGVGALAILLAGCSVHPLPDDVTRVSTVDIVKSIRCEALAGIDSLKPEERARAEPILKATVIGFDFLFTIDEKNSANGDPKSSLLTLANGSKLTESLTSTAFLERGNTRRFTIIDALADLPKPENRALCSNKARENWAYPIGGSIGMDEVVRTYLKLEMISELQTASSFNNPRVKGRFTNIVFADDLSFTTHVEAGAKTRLVLDAVVGRLKVTNAALGVSASRDDTHSVIVALTRKNIQVDEPAVRDRAALLTSGAIRDPRTQAQLIQVDAEAKTRVAMELYRRRGLNDIDNEPARALGQRLLDVLKVP